ncbi:hypothetical protein BG844_04740 [Couchioplanes caeruleus subsp. caeruleus]|uniref:Uncharacterized protein n=2 Tax=Couchioplanes caeruleus TaxID=56438 RepID=A0A1K0FRG3_9ACTN|nr:hypothetical protein BG844_04740 [Couchioplanes caeruleus subsp. caeruleus]
MLSGRQFGLCPTTVRPVPRGHPGVRVWRRWELYLSPELPGWTTFCGCPGLGPVVDCGCDRDVQVSLPGGVQQVLEVRVDGQTLPASAYRVDNRRWLVRTDGGRWPTRQELTAGDDQPGAFAVTYERGVPVPAAGRWAGGHLACEIAKAAVGDTKCRLPRRVSAIVRQGVHTEFVDPTKLARDGMTGIPEVDGWLAAVNPYGLPRDSVVWSADLPSPRRRTS